MSKSPNKKNSSVTLAKKTAYLVVFGIPEPAIQRQLRLYVKYRRVSVFGLLQQPKHRRQAIDAWMDKAVIGDVLVDPKREWTLTVISTERLAIQTLMDIRVDPESVTESMYSKRGGFNG